MKAARGKPRVREAEVVPEAGSLAKEAKEEVAAEKVVEVATDIYSAHAFDIDISIDQVQNGIQYDEVVLIYFYRILYFYSSNII